MHRSAGVTVTDLDDNELFDLSGSYGVNLFGYDFYKECIEAAVKRVGDLGPVLGAYHPVVACNVVRLREISGLDEVSFHMSGTEAVMQAVRLARYHTGRSHIVRFCGAYHGVLIFDEVFVGFRLAFGGAQEYFGVRADMVTYGKTLGGGLPVGALCGRKDLMKRFREERPVDVCFARGTFNSHPYVMAAMHEFLQRLQTEPVAALYTGLDEVWNGRARMLNERLTAAGLPVQLVNLSSIWVVCYTQPGCYNWMFQFYLRAGNLALSWVGTSRLIFSLNYSDADFAAVDRQMTVAAGGGQRGCERQVFQYSPKRWRMSRGRSS